jgi:CheY-like chemotaxis protein
VHSPDVVAVINTAPDTVDLLKDALERAGFVVVSTYTHAIRDGEVDIEAFLRAHQPKVIVYDIAPPYERNWALFQNLRQTVLSGHRFVLTSVNSAQVEKLVGRDERVYEVVGHSDDLGAVVQATREAARARDTR